MTGPRIENPVQTLPTALRGRTVSSMIRSSGHVAAKKLREVGQPDGWYDYWEGRLDGIATALAWIESAPTKPTKARIEEIAAEMIKELFE